MLFIAACDEGPAEEAGEAIDDTVDEFDNQGPVEETGEAIEEGLSEAEDAAEEATEEIQ
ncbi:MAG: hypothetical protein HUJ31_12650 [Pseudomonadales bacterium]|nr:hypothetical protein [Pseudomonadales bacterium]